MMRSASARRTFRAIACAVAILLPPLALAAAQQSPDGDSRVTHAGSAPDTVWGALDGSVRSTSGAWLHDVEIVTLDNSLVTTRSGAGGSFRIDSITAGPHLIRFRRIGLVPLTVSVVVAPGTTTSVDAVVQPMTIMLKRVVVQGKSGELLHLPSGVAERMRYGLGHYITADEIAAQRPINTADIFRHVAGLSVRGRVGAEIIENTRGAAMLTAGTDAAGATVLNGGCPAGMNVVLDGADMDASGPDGNTAGGGAGVVDLIAPSDIAAVEIYKDDVESPASLHGSPCGTIYIWTK